MRRSRRKSFAVTTFPLILSVLSFAAFGTYLLFYAGSPELIEELRPLHVDLIEESLSGENVKTTSVSDKITVSYPKRLNEPDNAAYPQYRSLLDVVEGWNPDDPDPPSGFIEMLQHFNYSDPNDMIAAIKFREAEVPFKIFNVPEFDSVAVKWDDHYLSLQFRSLVQSRRVERSRNNHFMYWNANLRSNIRFYEPPTEYIDDMPFDRWLRIAQHADSSKVKNESVHYYFMSNAPPGSKSGSFISRDLGLLSADENNFFVFNVEANKGIQCRFGMRGIIAEAHYDSGRNMVAMLKGAKRYILNPPRECKNLGLIVDKKHPSYRHSTIDWSNIDQATSEGFASVDAVDTILQKGEVLYIPSYWFHYIVSLKYSIQCNSRSGSPPNLEGQAEIEDCLGNKLHMKK